MNLDCQWLSSPLCGETLPGVKNKEANMQREAEHNRNNNWMETNFVVALRPWSSLWMTGFWGFSSKFMTYLVMLPRGVNSLPFLLKLIFVGLWSYVTKGILTNRVFPYLIHACMITSSRLGSKISTLIVLQNFSYPWSERQNRDIPPWFSTISKFNLTKFLKLKTQMF